MNNKSRAEKQKRKILVTAAKLFHKKGYSNTSVDEIADRLKINKATIYYYFEDKSHILFHVMCSALEGYIRRAEVADNEIHNISDKIENTFYFLIQLFRSAYDMGIVLSEFSNSQ